MPLRRSKAEAILFWWDGPAQNAGLPVIKRQARCLSHQSREARGRLDPGSKSGVTNERQSAFPRFRSSQSLRKSLPNLRVLKAHSH